MWRINLTCRQHCKWCENATSGLLYLVNSNLFLNCSDILPGFMEHNLIFLLILPFIAANVFYIVLKSNLLSSCRELCVVMTKWTRCIKATNHLPLWDYDLTVIFFLQVIEAGANALVAGSAVFGAPDYAEGKDIKFFILPYWEAWNLMFID